MAYITKKSGGGNVYYYAEESHRVNGKRCRKWQKYLGPLNKIISAVEGANELPKYAEIFQFGAPAAYLHVTEKIDLVNNLDKWFAKRQQGISIGLYLVIAAINRGINTVSKNGMWEWYKDTILLRVFPEVTKPSVSSQRFWDNFSKIDTGALKEIWLDLVSRITQQEGIDLSTVSYDGTNFYTFISSFNTHCPLAKRGKNKQGRRDLRQISYALFCTRKEHFPLYYDIYEGNTHDAKQFKKVIARFHEAYQTRGAVSGGMTIVLDKGNNSKDNFKIFAPGSNLHFVGSVKVDDHKDLSLVSNKDGRFEKLTNPKLEEVKAFRVKKKIYDIEMTVVVSHNNNLYSSQIQSINNEIDKCMGKLQRIMGRLQERRAGIITKGKKPTVDSVKKNVASILTGQYMKRLIDTEVEAADNLPELTYWLNTDEYKKLADTYLGKNIIITDNHLWKTEDIILTYRSQYIIEDIFKQMKDRKTGTWWPLFHWTDQMIHVHGFYCSLTVLIRALMMKYINDAGLVMSVNKLHDKIAGIREVCNIFAKRASQSVISKLDDSQKKLFKIFNMKKYLAN